MSFPIRYRGSIFGECNDTSQVAFLRLRIWGVTNLVANSDFIVLNGDGFGVSFVDAALSR